MNILSRQIYELLEEINDMKTNGVMTIYTKLGKCQVLQSTSPGASLINVIHLPWLGKEGRQR